MNGVTSAELGFSSTVLRVLPGSPDHQHDCVCFSLEALRHGPQQRKEITQVRLVQGVLVHDRAQMRGLPAEELHGSADAIWRKEDPLHGPTSLAMSLYTMQNAAAILCAYRYA